MSRLPAERETVSHILPLSALEYNVLSDTYSTIIHKRRGYGFIFVSAHMEAHRMRRSHTYVSSVITITTTTTTKLIPVLCVCVCV